ncbi:FGGY family carbohydrate kinase [Jatrophihabitans telluris]|uniref:ATP:glycerol 3-phosphotransferase n=1 Tax=Jatrophihabitans telluris TaxID=2038343 RepID=A0ABY4QVU4_9ACTN|nr:FGGY family carbohydrate kinase [Jatrophihabitans telluris]UQX86986.1 FGGY family carbohydrate kinase [Jatrophihabitans telluris]
MTAQAILAIDQGTSGTKAIVVDPDDGVVAVAEEPVQPVYLPGGGVEQDPDELLSSVLAAGRRAVAAAGRPVAAVSLANQGETVLAWDRRNGRPLSRAIVWQDRRAEGLVAELASSGGWVTERTGLVLDPYFSAPKMAWLRRNVTTEGVVTTTDSWLVHHLCGEFVTDVSTASRSLLAGLDSGAWDPELCALFGWQHEPLPRIVACDEVVGSTTAFGTEVPVAGLVVDQQAALLAEGCVEPGAAKCTFGTGAFLLANTGTTAVRSGSGLTSSVAWRARGQLTYCLDGQVYTAASAVRWLQDLGLIGGPEDLDRLAADDAGGVLCVPALAGLAAPWWRSDATAVLSGMTLATRPGHLILAVLQGIAAQVAELAALVDDETGEPLSRLRVDGGLTRCRTLMQSVADVLQLPLDVYPSPHATALGAATLARLALTPRLGVADAITAWEPTHSFEPRWSADQAWDFRGRWRSAVTIALGSETRR